MASCRLRYACSAFSMGVGTSVFRMTLPRGNVLFLPVFFFMVQVYLNDNRLSIDTVIRLYVSLCSLKLYRQCVKSGNIALGGNRGVNPR